ncbi:HD domain-containing phosphohydrolase [Fontivita pretiosa]|uniref:HD domain-containing phosphohydrolase n=1 Tax=Fontivita pretiosa TaxID=2989684 RepID=UPI003D167DE1
MNQLPPADRELASIVRLLDALNCGAALIDRAGRLVHVNARLCAMMRRPCRQLVGANILDFYPDAPDRAIVRQSLDRFDEGAETEFFLPLPDGKKLPIIASARPLSGPPPLSDHRIVTMIDISAQKQAEQSAREQYDLIIEMSDTLLHQALELKKYSQTLEDRVRQRTEEIRQAHMDAIYMLAVASEAKDEDTGRHVRRIQHHTRELARRLGFSHDESEAIGYSAILHDVGKIHVPDSILTKPGPLDDHERARMQLHTLAGERILSPNPFFDRARRIARWHHENFDGSGYPDGLERDAIPIEARIVHLADVYDALTHSRVYKRAWSDQDAIREISRQRGIMFDPAVVDAFNAAALPTDLDSAASFNPEPPPAPRVDAGG